MPQHNIRAGVDGSTSGYNLSDYVSKDTLIDEFNRLPEDTRNDIYGGDFETYAQNRQTQFSNMIGYGKINPDTLAPIPSQQANQQAPKKAPTLYWANGKYYDIPDSVNSRFLEKNPNAEIVTRLEADGRRFDIPQSRLDAFKRKYPTAVAVNEDNTINEQQLPEELLTNEVRRIRDKTSDTIDVSPVMRIDNVSEEVKEEVSGAFEAFGRNAMTYLPETLGGIGGGALAVALISNPVGAVVGGLLGGFAFAMGAGWGKNAILEEVAPEFKAGLDVQLERDIEEHPLASFAGQVAPQLIAFRPSPKNLKNFGKFTKHLTKNWEKRGDIFKTEAGREGVSNMINVTVGSATESGVEMYRQIESGDWSGARLALALTTGALINEPNKIGRAIGFKPTKSFMKDLETVKSNLKTSVELAESGQVPSKTKLYQDDELVNIETAPQDVDVVQGRADRLNEEIASRKEAIPDIDGRVKDIDAEIKDISNEIKIIRKASPEELDELGIANKKDHIKALSDEIENFKGQKKDLRGQRALANKELRAKNKELKSVLKELPEDVGEITVRETSQDEVRIKEHQELSAKEKSLMSRWKELDANDPEKLVIERELDEISKKMSAINDEGVDWVVTERKAPKKQHPQTRRMVFGDESGEVKLLPEVDGSEIVSTGSRVRVANLGKHGGKTGDVVKVYKNGNMKVRFDDGSHASIKESNLETVSRPVRPKKGQIYIDPQTKRVIKGMQAQKKSGDMGEAGEMVKFEGDRDFGVDPRREPLKRDKPIYTDVEDNFVRQKDGSWNGRVGNRTYSIVRMKAGDIHEGSGFVWYDLGGDGRYLGRTKKEAIRTLQQVEEAPLRGISYDNPKNIEGKDITAVAKEEGAQSQKPFSIERGRGRTLDRVFKKVDKYSEQGGVPREHQNKINALKKNAEGWQKNIDELEANPNYNKNDPDYVRAKYALKTALAKLDEAMELDFMHGTTMGLEFMPLMNRIVGAFDTLVGKHGSRKGKARLRAINKREKELLDKYRMGDKSVEEELDMLSTTRSELTGDELGVMTPKGLKDFVVEEKPITEKEIRKSIQWLKGVKQLQNRSDNKYFKSMVYLLQRSQETENQIMGTYFEGLRKFKVERLKPKHRERLADILEGVIKEPSKGIDKKLFAVADEMRSSFDRMHRDAIDIGIDVKGYIENYFPKMINREVGVKIYGEINTIKAKLETALAKSGVAGDEAYSDRILTSIINKEITRKTKLAGMLEHLIETKQARDLNEAYRKLKFYTGETLFRPFQNMEKARRLVLPAKFYERDAVKVYERYLRGYSTRYAEVKHMGGPTIPDFTTNHKLLMMEDADLARDIDMAYKMWNGTIYMDKTFGKGTMTLIRWSQKTTSGLVGTKIGLGFATIPNLFQTLYSVWTRTGTKTYIKGILSTLSPKARSEMRRSGIVVDDAIKAMANIEHDGMMNKFAEKTLKYSGFNAVNKMNNYISASSAKHLIGSLYRKASKSGKSAQKAKRVLRRYGFNPDKMPSNERMGNFMYRFATDTQLLRNIARDPLVFHDPRYQWAFLFKKFGVKQFMLIKDDLMTLYREGDKSGMAGYLTRLSLATGISGLGGESIRNLVKQKLGTKEDYTRIPANEFEDFANIIANAGSVGVTGDLVASSIYAKEPISAIFKTATPVHIDFIIESKDNLVRFIQEAHGDSYGFKNAFLRAVPHVARTMGSVTSHLIGERAMTPKQRKQDAITQKGRAHARIYEAIQNNRFEAGFEMIYQHNLNYPDNPIVVKDIISGFDNYLKKQIKNKINY